MVFEKLSFSSVIFLSCRNFRNIIKKSDSRYTYICAEKGEMQRQALYYTLYYILIDSQQRAEYEYLNECLPSRPKTICHKYFESQ